MAGSDALKIAKVSQDIRIKLRDGSWLPSTIFLDRYTERNQGPEHVLNLLNDPEPYLPVMLTDDKVRLVRKKAILLVAMPQSDGMSEIDPNGDLSPQIRFVKAMISLVTGESHSGLLPVEAPRVSGHRVSDWLNQKSSFFPFITRREVLYIPHRAVIWIDEQEDIPLETYLAQTTAGL